MLEQGAYLAQSDGTSWMGVYALNMFAIAVELASHDSSYEDIASKFFEHFLIIADAMNSLRPDEYGLWDPGDAFYYDQLYLPDGERIPLKVRSVVGIVPLFAVEALDASTLDQLPRVRKRIEWFLANRPELAENVARIDVGGKHDRRLLAIVNPDRLRTILRRVFDETEFLSPHGIRMLSRYHLDHPYVVCVAGREFRCDYEPAESTSGLFGGNSNWRGPVWFPLNYLLIESLQKFHHYLGEEYKIEFPTGSGTMLTLWDISQELAHRLVGLFRRDARRPPAVQRRGRAISERYALARSDSVPRILPRRNGRRTRRITPNRLDGSDRPTGCVRRPGTWLDIVCERRMHIQCRTAN